MVCGPPSCDPPPLLAIINQRALLSVGGRPPYGSRGGGPTPYRRRRAPPSGAWWARSAWRRRSGPAPNSWSASSPRPPGTPPPWCRSLPRRLPWSGTEGCLQGRGQRPDVRGQREGEGEGGGSTALRLSCGGVLWKRFSPVISLCFRISSLMRS